MDIEGKIDLAGFFGLRPVAPGLTDLRLTVRAASDADPAVLEDILAGTRAASPVFDSLSRPVEVATRVVPL